MKRFNQKNSKKGFSLVELAIVILVISILISGVMSVSIGASDGAKIKATKDKLDEIYRAMGNYLRVNGRLPCPAPITAIKGSVDYGKDLAVGTGDCLDNGAGAVSGIYYSSANNLVYGMVPVQNLKLKNDMAQDEFGSKIGYIVDKRLTGFNENASSNDFNNAPFNSVISINQNGLETVTVTQDAVFVLISYGKNKSGAFDIKSATQNIQAVDSDESQNDDVTATNFDNLFVSAADKSDVFDDIVFFKTKKNLIVDFNVYHLVHCPYVDTDLIYVDDLGTKAQWPDTKYGQVAVANNACSVTASDYNGIVVKPTRKCQAFGQWQTEVLDSCQ